MRVEYISLPLLDEQSVPLGKDSDPAPRSVCRRAFSSVIACIILVSLVVHRCPLPKSHTTIPPSSSSTLRHYRPPTTTEVVHDETIIDIDPPLEEHKQGGVPTDPSDEDHHQQVIVNDYAQVPAQYIKKRHSHSTAGSNTPSTTTGSGNTVTLTLSGKGEVINPDGNLNHEEFKPHDRKHSSKMKQQQNGVLNDYAHVPTQYIKKDNEAIQHKEKDQEAEYQVDDLEGVVVEQRGQKLEDEDESEQEEINAEEQPVEVEVESELDVLGGSEVQREAESREEDENQKQAADATYLNNDRTNRRSRGGLRRLIKGGGIFARNAVPDAGGVFASNAIIVAQVGEGTDQQGINSMEPDE
jgi:hypothetical protein